MNQWLDWKARNVAQIIIDGLYGCVLARLPHKTIENPNVIKRWSGSSTTDGEPQSGLDTFNRRIACGKALPWTLNPAPYYSLLSMQLARNWTDHQNSRGWLAKLEKHGRTTQNLEFSPKKKSKRVLLIVSIIADFPTRSYFWLAVSLVKQMAYS